MNNSVEMAYTVTVSESADRQGKRIDELPPLEPKSAVFFLFSHHLMLFYIEAFKDLLSSVLNSWLGLKSGSKTV